MNFLSNCLKLSLIIIIKIVFIYYVCLVLDSHEMAIVTILDKLVTAHPEIKFGSYP